MRTQLVVVTAGVGMIVAVAAVSLAAGLRGGVLVAAVGGAWLLIATVDIVVVRSTRHGWQTAWQTIASGWSSVRSAPRRRPTRPPRARASVDAPAETSPPDVPTQDLPPTSSGAVQPTRPEPRQWNIWELERLARRLADPDEVSTEHAALLLHLRSYADAAGALPIEFDALVRESFADLFEVSQS